MKRLLAKYAYVYAIAALPFLAGCSDLMKAFQADEDLADVQNVLSWGIEPIW